MARTRGFHPSSLHEALQLLPAGEGRVVPAHVPALIDELGRTVTELERLASAASS